MIEVAVFEYHGHTHFEIADEHDVAAFQFGPANAKEVADALDKLSEMVRSYVSV